MLEALFRSERLTLGYWRCPGRDSEGPDAEPVTRPEVVLPVAGTYVRIQGHREVVASPNVALFGRPGEGYRVRHPADTPPDRCAVFLLRPRGVEELFGPLGSAGTARTRFPSAAVPVRASTFLQARELLRPGPRDPLHAEEASATILADLAEEAARRSFGRERGQRRAVVRASEYILARYTSPLSLDEIAGVAGYSTFHFARMFREETGHPVYRYVLRLRLRKAVDAILQGADDLSRLALGLGFSSHSHFTAAFRRAFGKPPSALRTGPPER